ncbi:MAG: type II secretion system F family protein [Anaeromyxobacteraceae bacterium]
MHVDAMALLIGTGFVAALAAATATVYSIVGSHRGAARQLQRRLAPSHDLPELVEHRSRAADMVAQGLAPIARLATPDDDELSRVRERLVQAGLRGAAAVPLFLAAKVILPLLLVGVVLWASTLQAEPIDYLSAWSVGVAVVGFLAPNLWLKKRVQSRQADIDRGLPDALDLMVTCVEAGLGLDAAVQRVALEIGLARPVLAEELTLTFLEVKAGVKRTEAFRRLADRTGVQDLKTLAATLNQTDIFGTSVSRALRVQAEGMRVRRMQRAEERAAILSVKMTMPLVLCFVPALFVVLVGPAWVNIASHFLRRGGS